MTHREFTLAVAEMRLLQKAYFKSRDRIILSACKSKEKQVDSYLSSFDLPTEEQRQLKILLN